MKIDELVVSDYNPREITNEALKKLCASIKSHSKSIAENEDDSCYRLVTTITVNKQGNRIVGGHQRVKALNTLGQDFVHDDDITWVDLKPNSAEEKALNLSLNNSNAGGSWTEEVNKVLEDIAEEDEGLFDGLSLDELEIDIPMDIDLPESLPEPEVEGEDNRSGRVIIVYDDNDQFESIKSVLGFENDKVLYLYKECKKLAE